MQLNLILAKRLSLVDVFYHLSATVLKQDNL